LHRSANGEATPGAGVLTPQARLTHRGRTGLLDDLVGAGFLLACTEDPWSVLDDDQQAFLTSIGAHVLHVLPAGTHPEPAREAHCAVDVDGAYLTHFAAAGHVAALVRPDHYLFGSVTSMSEMSGLVADLQRQLREAAPRA
jgi:flavoprotein hydroxylase